MEKDKINKLLKSRKGERIILFLVVASILLLSACKRKIPKFNFYENSVTGEIMSVSDYNTFVEKLGKAYTDSTNGKARLYLNINIYDIRTSSDSVIGIFTYDVRIGKDFIVRNDSTRTHKINMKIDPHTFTTLNGDVITIGGNQDKPTMINLWFVGCSGCAAEIPTLNELHKKYADKMNFIALNYQDKKSIERFLNNRTYTFTQISDAGSFIDSIRSSAYPENIFIDKHGYIKYIEGVVPAYVFEEIIEWMIVQ